MWWFMAVAFGGTFPVDAPPVGSAWIEDANPGDGLCETSSGVCTLRAALEESASGVFWWPGSFATTQHEIVLPPGAFTMDEDVVLVPGTSVTVTGSGPATRIQPITGSAFVMEDTTLIVESLLLDGSLMAGAVPMIQARYVESANGDLPSLTVRDVDFTDAPGAAVSYVMDDLNAWDDVDTSVTLERLRMQRGGGSAVTVSGRYYYPPEITVDDLVVRDMDVSGSLFYALGADIRLSGVQILDSIISGSMATAIDAGIWFVDVEMTRNTAQHLLGNTGGPATDAALISFDGLVAKRNIGLACGSLNDEWSYIEMANSLVIGNQLANSLICGTPHVDRSVFANNHATGDGGVIQHYGWAPYGNWVRDSLFYRNSATGSGGAIYTDGGGFATDLSLRNLTLVGNVADSDGDGDGLGGNLWSADASLTNTVMSGGMEGNLPSDCHGTLSTSSHNFVAVEGSPGVCGLDTLSEVGSPSAPLDPMLTQRRTLPNGMPGIAPRAGSPLIDAGTARSGTDLGGQSRSLDGDGDGTAQTDIGAVERP